MPVVAPNRPHRRTAAQLPLSKMAGPHLSFLAHASFVGFPQDYLSPWEQQLAEQINAMNLPVHVEVRFSTLEVFV